MPIKQVPLSVKATSVEDPTLSDGQFIALASVFGNVDAVGDVVAPGAFTDDLKAWAASGDSMPIYWGHQFHDPHLNVGWVLNAEETDQGLQVKGQLDLDNPVPEAAAKARQVHRLIKGRRVRSMSFAYDVEDAAPAKVDGQPVTELRKLRVHEVSVVQVPANPEALIGAAKHQDPGITYDELRRLLTPPEPDAVKKALPSHSTATSEGTWDGPANEARLSNDAGAATYRRAYAWVDPNGDQNTKAAYRFIHHEVAADGTVGAANVKAAITGIGVLNGGMGGTTIPDADRAGVHAHLARHITDAGMDPPPLKASPPVNKGGWLPPGTVVVKAGRTLSAANEQRVRTMLTLCQELIDSMGPDMGPGTSDTGETATSAPAATAEEPPGVKAPVARLDPAHVRLLADLTALIGGGAT